MRPVNRLQAAFDFFLKLAIAQGKRHCGFGVDGGGVKQRHAHVHVADQHHDFGTTQDNRLRALFDQVQHDGDIRARDSGRTSPKHNSS